MWIERNNKNYLRMVERIEVDGKMKRVSVPLEKDAPAARKKAMAALQEKIGQIDRPQCEMRLNEAVELYLKRPGIRPATAIHAGSALRILAELIGDVKLRSLSAQMINRKVMEDGRPVMVRKLRYLKSMIRWCVKYGYMETDFAKQIDATLPKEKKDQKSLYLEHDELDRLFEQLTGIYLYASKFLVLTGMRVGEMSALTMDDIGTDRITINKNYCYCAGVYTEPKTVESDRTIYIQPELAELIREYKKWRKLYMMSLGIRTNLFFFSKDGSPLKENTLYQVLHRIDPKLHPHLFRHTHVALLAEAGYGLDAISRRLGHAGSNITRAVYYHVTEKQQKKDDDFLKGIRIL